MVLFCKLTKKLRKFQISEICAICVICGSGILQREYFCVETAVKRAVGCYGINFEDTLEKCDIRLSHQFYGQAEVVFER